MDTLDIKLERIIPVGAVSKAHSELEGLGYEESGHIGFASSQEVSAINERLGNVEKDYLKGEDKVSLQEQINTNAEAIRVLSDGIDPEKIDGLKEVADYVNEHVEEVVDINKRLTFLENNGVINLLSEPIIISNKLSDDTFEKEVNNFGLELGKKYTGVFYGTSSDFPYQGQPSVFTDVGASYLPYELPSGSYILEQFTGAISVFIYVNAKKENGVLVYNEGTTFIKVIDTYAENEITFESIMEAKPEYATVDSLNEVNGKVLSLEQSLKEVTQENVLGTIDIYPDENNQLIKNIEALNIKLNTEYTVKFITWGIGTEELTLSAFAQTGSQAGLDNDESYTLTFTLNNGQLIIYDKSKNVDGRIIYDENSAVIQCQGNDISELTLLSLTAPKSFASKEEVEALGERVDGLESKKTPFGEPLVVYAGITAYDRTISIENITGAVMVDWGDGSAIEDISSVTKYTHTYNATSATSATPYTIKFYGNITAIGSYAFSNLMSKIKGVDIPNTVTKIGARAFYNCYISPRITIPASVTSIGDFCFSDSGRIYIFEFLGAKPTLESGSRHFTSGTIIVPNRYLESYKTATDWAPYVDRLDSYALSSELENLGGSSTPSGEPLVATFQISSSSSPTGETVTVQNITGATMVDWGDGSEIEDISSVTTYTHTYDNSVAKSYEAKFYGDITSVGQTAFYQCKELYSIRFSNNITSVGKNAFYQCSGLSKVVLNNGLGSIGVSAFQSCTNISSISIPNTVVSLGESAFNGCSKLAYVDLPKYITTISKSLFRACDALIEVNIPPRVTTIDEQAFAYCYKLRYVYIPFSVSTINGSAFGSSSEIRTVTLQKHIPPNLNGSSHFSTNSATRFIVPYAGLNNYKTDTKWSYYASLIDAYAMASDIDNINTALTNIIEGEGV